MKKMVSVGMVAIMAALFAATPVLAFEGSADAYVGVYSKYLWRGWDLSTDEDEDFVVQPGVDVTISNFTVSFWGNISENTGEMNEVDLTLDYSQELSDLVSVSVGNIFYEVDGANDTNEVYAGISLNTILEPNLTVYYDYDEFEDTYAALSVGHGIELSDQMSLSLGALAGYLVDTESRWHNLDLSTGVDYALDENITVSGSALYTLPLSDYADNVRDVDGEGTVGVSVSFAF